MGKLFREGCDLSFSGVVLAQILHMKRFTDGCSGSSASVGSAARAFVALVPVASHPTRRDYCWPPERGHESNKSGTALIIRPGWWGRNECWREQDSAGCWGVQAKGCCVPSLAGEAHTEYKRNAEEQCVRDDDVANFPPFVLLCFRQWPISCKYYTNHERYWMQTALTQLFWYCTICLITDSFRIWLMQNRFIFLLVASRWWVWVWIYYYGNPLDTPQPSFLPFWRFVCTSSYMHTYWHGCSAPQ